LKEIIFIDDGSSDDSVELLIKIKIQIPYIKILQLSRNFGHHLALTAGLDRCCGDYVVMMDGDLQDLPEEIPTLFSRIDDKTDVVYANRVNKQFNIFKKLTANIFLMALKYISSDKVALSSSVFRVMKKKVVVNLRQLRERDRYLIGLIEWVGFWVDYVQNF
jgi:dolichol-phosphate mannosyltransferase